MESKTLIMSPMREISNFGIANKAKTFDSTPQKKVILNDEENQQMDNRVIYHSENSKVTDRMGTDKLPTIFKDRYCRQHQEQQSQSQSNALREFNESLNISRSNYLGMPTSSGEVKNRLNAGNNSITERKANFSKKLLTKLSPKKASTPSNAKVKSPKSINSTSRSGMAQLMLPTNRKSRRGGSGGSVCSEIIPLVRNYARPGRCISARLGETFHETPRKDYHRPPRGLIGASATKRIGGTPHKNLNGRMALTPVRVKAKFKKYEIQATNDGYASVKNLAAWLADDPTKEQTVLNVRRGRKVIEKSRHFEKGLENVIIEEANLRRGSVGERKISVDDNNDSGEEAKQAYYDSSRTANRRDWGDGVRSEIHINSAVSEISVTDKRQWLKNAFKGSDGRTEFIRKAKTSVEDESRDDVTDRAKKMWLQRASHRSTNERANATPKKAAQGEKNATHEIAFSHSKASNRNMLCPDARYRPENQNNQRQQLVVEEDRAEIDFRSARKKLIERSKKNGNELRINSKFNRRREAFENMEKGSGGYRVAARPAIQNIREATSYQKKSSPVVFPVAEEIKLQMLFGGNLSEC